MVLLVELSPSATESLETPRAARQSALSRRLSLISIVLLSILVGLLAVANYVGWVSNFFVADTWVLIGSINQINWSPIDLLPFRFWQLPHSLNPTFYYAPTLMVSTWLTVKLGGYNPEPYHLGLIALHLGTTVFLFTSVLQLTGSRLKATVAASLFAVHFASTEAVGWFGSNSHPIVGFFESMSLAFFVRYLTVRRPIWWIGTVIALVAGALTQASALAWFAVIACLDFLYARERHDAHGTARRIVFLGILLAGILLLQVQALSMAKGGYRYSLGPWVFLNLFYYPVSTVIPAVEENAISLARDLSQAPFDWNALTRLMGMRDAFNIILTALLTVIAFVLLWTKGGWISRFAVIGFALTIAPFLLINGQGYRYLYTPLMFFSLAGANIIGNLYKQLRSSSRTAAFAVVAIVPLFVLLSFGESQRQLFWWHQAGLVSHKSLQQLKALEPGFPPGAKIIFGGLPDTLQNTNAEVWRRGITEAVRAVYGDKSLRVESYGKEAVEQLFNGELKGAANTYGFVWDDWQLKQIAP